MDAVSLLPIIAIALLFWLLLIRPASKRQKDLARMQSALAPGDRVMLSAGIFATVVGIDDEAARIHVEVAPGTRLEVARGAIAQVLEPATVERPVEDRDRAGDWTDDRAEDRADDRTDDQADDRGSSEDS